MSGHVQADPRSALARPCAIPTVYPILHHDIAAVIPQPSQALVARVYQLWLALCATLIANLVSCILLLISGETDGGKDMIGAAVYVPFIAVPACVPLPASRVGRREHAR